MEKAGKNKRIGKIFLILLICLKEKSGTIWVPVLVHAILDFSVVLGY